MTSDSLDANLIIHFILGDIPAQRQKVLTLLITKNTIHHLSDLAISETVFVLEKIYQQTHSEIAQELSLFFETYGSALNYNRNLINLALPFSAAHPSLSFDDICLAFYSELNSAEPLFTFDEKLSHQHPSAKLLA